jgi:hypothetical protein
MIYFSFGDSPSGVLSSQAIDVVKYLRTLTKERIRFVAFISIRSFSKNKALIKAELSDALVLPMFPKINTWYWNWFTLALVCLLTGERKLIGRNVLAVQMALAVKRIGLLKVICLDGRGAMAAEWHEYPVVPNDKLKRNIASLEREAVLKTDFRIAVSQELVNYWQATYQYNGEKHVVIPCTLSLNFSLNAEIKGSNSFPNLEAIRNDIVLVYSGSTAGWQSFYLLEDFLTPLLTENKNVKVVFMSGKDEKIDALVAKFKQQVQRLWVPHEQVQEVLQYADYGILIREQTITNKVASPTKFAEYLSAGLQILISPELGDYSTFVKQQNCGQVIESSSNITFQKTTATQRQHNLKLVEQYFTKKSQKEQYLKLLEGMSTLPPKGKL